MHHPCAHPVFLLCPIHPCPWLLQSNRALVARALNADRGTPVLVLDTCMLAAHLLPYCDAAYRLL